MLSLRWGQGLCIGFVLLFSGNLEGWFRVYLGSFSFRGFGVYLLCLISGWFTVYLGSGRGKDNLGFFRVLLFEG